jgi:hypothetical protein
MEEASGALLVGEAPNKAPPPGSAELRAAEAFSGRPWRRGEKAKLLAVLSRSWRRVNVAAMTSFPSDGQNRHRYPSPQERPIKTPAWRFCSTSIVEALSKLLAGLTAAMLASGLSPPALERPEIEVCYRWRGPRIRSHFLRNFKILCVKVLGRCSYFPFPKGLTCKMYPPFMI